MSARAGTAGKAGALEKVFNFSLWRWDGRLDAGRGTFGRVTDEKLRVVYCGMLMLRACVCDASDK